MPDPQQQSDDFSDMDALMGRLNAEKDVQAKRAALQGKVATYNSLVKQAKPKAPASDDFSDMDALVSKLQPSKPFTWNAGSTQRASSPLKSVIQPAKPAQQVEVTGDQPHQAARAYDINAGPLGKSFPETVRQPIHALRGTRPPIRMTLPGRSDEELAAQRAETDTAKAQREESRREAANRTISDRVGLPLPRVLTEALADVAGGLESTVGSAVSGEPKPSVFNPLKSIVLQIPGAQELADKTIGRVGQAMQTQGNEASQVAGAPDGVRKDIGHAVGSLAPLLLARNPLAVGALTYDEARGQGANEGEAVERGITSAATVGAMGKAAGLIGRAIPEAGLPATLTRFGARAAANTAIAPLAEAPGRMLRSESVIPTDREKINQAVMGTGFAALPHSIEPTRARPPLATEAPGLRRQAESLILNTPRARAEYESQRAAQDTVDIASQPRLVKRGRIGAEVTNGQQATGDIARSAIGRNGLEDTQSRSAQLPADAQIQANPLDNVQAQNQRMASQPSAQVRTEAEAQRSTGQLQRESDGNQEVIELSPAEMSEFDRFVKDKTAQTTTPQGETGLEWINDVSNQRATEANNVRAIPQPAARVDARTAGGVAESARHLAGAGQSVSREPALIKTRTPQNRSVKPESDSLLAAIQKIGFDSSIPEGKELARYLSVKEGGRPGMVNKQRLPGGEKRGVDNLVRELEDYKFDFGDGVKVKKADVLLDLARQEQAGKPVYSQAYDHDAAAMRGLQAHLEANHSPEIQQPILTLADAINKHAEFGELSDRIAHGEASDAEIKHFAEIGRYELNLDPDAIESFVETSEDAKLAQGRGTESGIEAGEQTISGAQRGAVRDAAETTGDVNVRSEANAILGADTTTGSAGESGMANAGWLRAPADSQPSAPARTDYIHDTLDRLTERAKDTKRSLTDLVDEHLSQPALPGQESTAFTPEEAGMARSLAASYDAKSRRAPVKESQSFLLETEPTVESKAAQARDVESQQGKALANSPLFEGKPDWVNQNLDVLTQGAEKSGLADKIEELSAQRRTAKEVARELGTDADTVRAVRAKRGIPSMDDAGEFNQWLADRQPPHHSQLQPRDDEGKFALEEKPVEIPKGEHGKFINSLFFSPDIEAGIPAFWANPEVRAKLGIRPMPKIGERNTPERTAYNKAMSESKDALAKDIGKPRSSHLTPDDIRQWASDNGLGQDVLTALDAGEAQYRAKQAMLESRKTREGGFIRFGKGKETTTEPVTNERLRRIAEANQGKGEMPLPRKKTVQSSLDDLFDKSERVPLDKAANAVRSDWEDFEPMGGKANAPRAGEAYYESKGTEKDKLLSLRTLDSWMKANMLMGLSPYTHKVGSLLSNIAAEEAARPFTAAVDYVRAKSTGTERTQLEDVRGMLNAAGEAVTTGAKEAWQIFRNGATEAQMEEFGKPNELNTRNPVVNAMVNYTFRAFKAGAHIPGMYHYTRAMNMQARVMALSEAKAGKISRSEVNGRVVDILDGKGVPEGEQALMEGNALLAYADGVFQSDNSLNNLRRKVVDAGGPKWAFTVNRVVPFMKSASNAYLKMLDYTGVGPKGAAAETYRAVSRKVQGREAFKTDADRTAFAQAWGKLPVGVALFAAGVALHRNNLMTSLIYHHDDNPQPGSVTIGGKLVDVARYSPIGLIMAAGATFDELTGSKGEDPLTAGVVTTGEGATNLPMFQQTTDLIKTATALAQGKTSIPGVAVALGKAAVTRTLPTMIPGYSTVRDVYKSATGDQNYPEKVLHIKDRPVAMRTVDEAMVHQANREANPLPPMTDLKRTEVNAKQEIEQAMRSHDPNTAKTIEKHMAAGEITEKDLYSLSDKVNKSSEQRMMEEFKATHDLERKLTVFNQLSVDGKNKLRDEFEMEAMRQLPKLPPYQQKVLGPRIGQALRVQ